MDDHRCSNIICLLKKGDAEKRNKPINVFLKNCLQKVFVIMLELNKLVYPHMHVSLCIYFEDRSHQMFINGEDSDLQYSHDEELHRAGFAQNSPERDQDCGCAEVCVNHSERRGNKTEIIG